MSTDEVFEMSLKAEKNLVESEIYKKSDVIMLYYPLGKETDTSYIFKSILKDDKKAVYPVTNEITNEIKAVLVDDKTEFLRGAYSIFEPQGKEIDKNEIDMVIVPGIAFDKTGNRIGFGKGCYDKFLEDIKALKIGFCYDFQIESVIDADSYDIKMDYIVSECDIIECEVKDVI